ncbi:amino acid adenylation domain-containing protein [Micromonospora tulbaghiae]|uniref:amino acid adenylation domain-containing protein n=1 Tax=Micromonospora tulbaghiae TaxID=479978 RepID=UPI003668C6A7
MVLGDSLHEIFQARAIHDPDRVAVVAGDEAITYGGLRERAEHLALRLRAAGIGPGSFVGLCLEPGPDLVAGMLGILTAGGAYVPIDPAYPAARIEYLLRDSAVTTTVTAGALRDRLPSSAAVELVDAAPQQPDASPAPAVGRSDLAYVIYTSGSTGEPKGVMVEHGNVIRLFEQLAPVVSCDERDVWTMFHSGSFDFSVWEIWGALLHGGRLVVVPAGARRAPAHLLTLLREQRVTVLSQTPSAFRQLIAADAAGPAGGFPDLRYVVLGGERLDVAMLRPWIARHGDDRPELINMYGITETTVHVTHRRIRSADLADPGVSPIGVPIADLRIRLCDETGAVVPDGVPGDIEVAGPGVARGYLGRPQLTAERFVTDPEGVRWYRSGDRAVRRADGELVYLGRSDDQLKVSGYRIEPGEVEAVLAAHPAVSGALVTTRDHGDGDVRLVAYAVPAPGAERSGSLAAELTGLAAERLPAHLRPSAVHVVDEVPLTPQGKADHEALWAMTSRAATGSRVPDAAGDTGDPLVVVTAIVEEILGRGGLRADEDLFDARVTSLAFVRIIAAINERFGLSLTGAELDGSATLETLAACVTAGSNEGVRVAV